MVQDNYQEHELHKEFDPQCSTCFSENLRVKESGKDYNEMTKNMYGSNYPAGYIPE